jgi:hypothetical protein
MTRGTAPRRAAHARFIYKIVYMSIWSWVHNMLTYPQPSLLPDAEYEIPSEYWEDAQTRRAHKVANLDPALRDRAVSFLFDDLFIEDHLERIRGEIARAPEDWWVPYHFGFMMRVRNRLRQNGFGEKEFGIDNLDDYAVELVELAAEVESPPA